MEESKERIAELVRQIQNGDNSAFNELYKLTNGRAYFVALEITKNEQDAEDVLQESYIKMLEKINTLDKPESFVSWFHHIVANRSKDSLKKKKPSLFEGGEDEAFEVIPDEDTSFSPEENLNQDELHREVMEVIDELTEEKRACVMMMYFEEMSVNEISESLEIPVSTVKNRLWTARKDLKSKFEKRGITSLYSTAPVGVVIWALRRACESTSGAFEGSAGSARVLSKLTVSGGAAAAASAAGTGGAAASAASAGGATAAASAAGTAAKAVVLTTAQKVIAGVVAVGIIGGSAAGIAVTVRNNNADSETTTVVEEVTTAPDFEEESVIAAAAVTQEETSESETQASTSAETSATKREPTSKPAASTAKASTTAAKSATTKATAVNTTAKKATTTKSTTVRPTTTKAATTKAAATKATTARATTTTKAATTTTTAAATTTAPATTTTTVATTQAPATLTVSVIDLDDTVADTLTLEIEPGTQMTWEYLFTAIKNKGYTITSGFDGNALDAVAESGASYNLNAYL